MPPEPVVQSADDVSATKALLPGTLSAFGCFCKLLFEYPLRE